MDDLSKKIEKALNERKDKNLKGIKDMKKQLHGGITDSQEQWDLVQFIAASYDIISKDKGMARALVYGYLELMDIEIDNTTKQAVSLVLTESFEKNESLWDFISKIRALDTTARIVFGKSND